MNREDGMFWLHVLFRPFRIRFVFGQKIGVDHTVPFGVWGPGVGKKQCSAGKRLLGFGQNTNQKERKKEKLIPFGTPPAKGDKQRT